MKQCTTCKRTYADDTQSFCLEDGTPLTAFQDAEATLVINPPHNRPVPATVPAREQSSLPVSAARSANPGLYIVIALLALLAGGGLVALIRSGAQSTETAASPAAKPSVTPNAASTLPPKQSMTPPEKHEWTMFIPATVKWQDTGIRAELGDRINVSAKGSVVWDTDLPAVGPDGTFAASTVENPSDFPLPQAGCGSLVMRIGNSKYAVGSNASVTAQDEGNIQLMVNDRLQTLANNRGGFTVTIRR